MISVLLNAVIFIATLIIVIMYFRKDGKWDIAQGLIAFGFFTIQSNVLCGIAALLMVFCQLRGHISRFVWMLKYLGTASVAVTMVTVFVFLGPTMGGVKGLLIGKNLYLHLIGPLLGIVSFCFLEKGHMSVKTALTGVIPVILYGLLYLSRVVFVPESMRWPDFYGFNRGGMWPVSYAAMVVGTSALCLILRLL